MTSQIVHFLLVFDHHEGRLVDQIDYGHDSKAALAAYATQEHLHRENPHIDIVLVGSDSIETVKATHSNYFDGSAATAKSQFLVGL